MSEIKNTAMQSIGSRGIQLQVFDDLWRFAQMAVASGFAPKGFDATAATVAIQMGMELGVTPMQALQGIAVVNGRPCVYGDLGVALVRGSGELENVEERFGGKDDGFGAECKLMRKGQSTPILGTFTIADAKRAKLWGKAGPWTQYPKRMLMWRARTYAYRDGFADVLRGMTFREEAIDIPPPREPEYQVQGNGAPESFEDVIGDSPEAQAEEPQQDAEQPQETFETIVEEGDEQGECQAQEEYEDDPFAEMKS